MKLFPSSKWARVRLAILLGLLLYILSFATYGYFQYNKKEGDLIFQSLPFGELTTVIEGATNSPYSHVGLVIYKNGFWYVREAIGKVRDTHLLWWILRGRGDTFSVYRLKEAYKQNIPKFIEESQKMLGYPYDFHYRLDDTKIYCSELIYKAYKRVTNKELGKITTLEELNWKPYKDFILSIENTIPLDRKMITPKDLSEADELELVFSNYERVNIK